MGQLSAYRFPESSGLKWEHFTFNGTGKIVNEHYDTDQTINLPFDADFVILLSDDDESGSSYPSPNVSICFVTKKTKYSLFLSFTKDSNSKFELIVGNIKTEFSGNVLTLIEKFALSISLDKYDSFEGERWYGSDRGYYATFSNPNKTYHGYAIKL